MKDDLETQWKQDIEDYGDNAYLMWKSFGIRDYPHRIYANFNSNDEATDIIINGFDDSMERKQSAELPFDLERAKAGHEIQVINSGVLSDCKYVNEYDGYLDDKKCTISWGNHNYRVLYNFNNLRMKYPPKINK